MENDIRTKILKTAYDLFLEKGYAAATTREVAERSGLERGHLYYYYKKKEELFFAWYKRLLDAIRDEAGRMSPEGTSVYVKVLLFDLIYDGIISADSKMEQLLKEVLADVSLSKSKVKYVYEAIAGLFPEESINREDLLAGTCILIGAEVEMNAYAMEKDPEIHHVADRLRELHLYTFGLSSEERKKVKEEAEVLFAVVTPGIYEKLLQQAVYN